MRRVLVVTLLIGGIALLMLTAILSFARQNEPKQWMFVSDDGAFYRLTEDGREMRTLANVDVLQVEMSPDRNAAIVTIRDLNALHPNLYRMNFAGNRFRKLADTPDGVHFVGWRPGQDQFVFIQFAVNGDPQLYVWDTNGYGIEPLLPPELLDMRFGTWLSDDQGMIMLAPLGDAFDIVRVNADFSVENLTSLPRLYVILTLTRDGEWLLFERYGVDGGIYRMKVDGSQVEALNDSVYHE